MSRRLGIVRFPLAAMMTPEREEGWLNLRRHDVTASTVGALFGVHPYQTAAGLWAEKTGTVLPKDVPELKALRRGRIMEVAVAKAWQEKHPEWHIRKAQVYLRAKTIRLGATPDFFVREPPSSDSPDGDEIHFHGRAVLQTKTVAPAMFRRYWTETSAPLWIVLQTLTEAMLANTDFGIIAALVVDGYNFDLHEYRVPRHAMAELRIEEAVRKFWKHIEDGTEPVVDYTRDRPLVDLMFPHAVPTKMIDLRGDNQLPELLEERDKLMHAYKETRERIDTIETELRAKMGDAEAAVISGGWKATLKDVHRKEYTVKASDFRHLRISRQEEQ